MELNNYIEHTILRADTTKEDIKRICDEALTYQFVGICIPPYYLKYAKERIKDSAVKLVTVVGFPLGYQAVSTKVEESRKALEDGADEIDMVINIAALKNKEYNHMRDGIESVATLCRLKSKVLKVIIETALLSDEEIIKACEICTELGVDYVKTSTGFYDGAKLEHIKLMREVLPKNIKIKASGGIRDLEFAKKLIKAGADRLGTSAGVKILKETTT